LPGDSPEQVIGSYSIPRNCGIGDRIGDSQDSHINLTRRVLETVNKIVTQVERSKCQEIAYQVMLPNAGFDDSVPLAHSSRHAREYSGSRNGVASTLSGRPR
jgi:hypothetical protein